MRASNLIMCSFCGKSHDDPEVRKLIAGPGVYICDGCINVRVLGFVPNEVIPLPIPTRSWLRD